MGQGSGQLGGSDCGTKGVGLSVRGIGMPLCTGSQVMITPCGFRAQVAVGPAGVPMLQLSQARGDIWVSGVRVACAVLRGRAEVVAGVGSVLPLGDGVGDGVGDAVDAAGVGVELSLGEPETEAAAEATAEAAVGDTDGLGAGATAVPPPPCPDAPQTTTPVATNTAAAAASASPRRPATRAASGRRAGDTCSVGSGCSSSRSAGMCSGSPPPGSASCSDMR